MTRLAANVAETFRMRMIVGEERSVFTHHAKCRTPLLRLGDIGNICEHDRESDGKGPRECNASHVPPQIGHKEKRERETRTTDSQQQERFSSP